MSAVAVAIAAHQGAAGWSCHLRAVGVERRTTSRLTVVKQAPSWGREERQPFAGWDFSRLAGRMQTERPALVLRGSRRHFSGLPPQSRPGPGGGEHFLELLDAWPPARATDIDPLPFGNGASDLVLSRHTANSWP